LRSEARSGEFSAQYEGWRVAAASSVGVFVSFASVLVYTFGIFLKPFAETFSWSREAVSTAFGIAAMTVAVCSPPLGYLLDRLDPRRIIVPCLIVFGCAFASLALLTAYLWHLYLTFLVLGIVGNGTAQMAYTRAVSSWFMARRGMALALVMSGGAIGAMVLPPIATALIARIGWRATCATLGAIVLALGVPVVARFVRERPHDPENAGAAAETRLGVPLREALIARPF
jgi:MFS family permease